MGGGPRSTHATQATKTKGVAASSSPSASKKKKAGSKSQSGISVNPAETVRGNWAKVPPKEFKVDRLDFNPYAFGASTCSDIRFYCKMHEAIYEFILSEFAHPHCPDVYFDVDQARIDWPDVMELMDYHGLTYLMTVRDSFSPDLVKEFFATVYFSKESPRTMT